MEITYNNQKSFWALKVNEVLDPLNNKQYTDR